MDKGRIKEALGSSNYSEPDKPQKEHPLWFMLIVAQKKREY